MLQPKRTKFRKMHKMKMKGDAKRGSQISFGSFAIKANEGAWVTARQIEAARVAVTRFMKREGQIWIRIFPDKPITKKPAEVRMGKAPDGGGNDLFAHFSATQSQGFKTLAEGQRVTFDVTTGPKGQQASNIRVA